MERFMPLVIAAIVVEGIISYAKKFFIDGKFQWQNIVAICLGVLLAIAYRIDLFDIMGLVSHIKYLGMILTGILISRGSNYVFELIKKLTVSNERDRQLIEINNTRGGKK